MRVNNHNETIIVYSFFSDSFEITEMYFNQRQRKHMDNEIWIVIIFYIFWSFGE